MSGIQHNPAWSRWSGKPMQWRVLSAAAVRQDRKSMWPNREYRIFSASCLLQSSLPSSHPFWHLLRPADHRTQFPYKPYQGLQLSTASVLPQTYEEYPASFHKQSLAPDSGISSRYTSESVSAFPFSQSMRHRLPEKSCEYGRHTASQPHQNPPVYLQGVWS